jgi:hypothetical protein
MRLYHHLKASSRKMASLVPSELLQWQSRASLPAPLESDWSPGLAARAVPQPGAETVPQSPGRRGRQRPDCRRSHLRQTLRGRSHLVQLPQYMSQDDHNDSNSGQVIVISSITSNPCRRAVVDGNATPGGLGAKEAKTILRHSDGIAAMIAVRGFSRRLCRLSLISES